ncbi:ABC transporter ATP-binding protein [Blautia stercoris]|mgnify:FL=1|uniref:ABC transporter ATP-binding protein n=1 Tax=Blautia stercoris TaxID=871664 RepID=UPI00355B1EF3
MIDVSNVTISFEEENQTHVILDDVSLNIEKGEFICLLGPSGCGKSTLLNAMAGFLKPTSGEIKIENQIVQKPSMKYVTIFQNYGLLPWRTVQKNVELGLETQKYSKEKKAQIASHYLKMVGLEHAAKKRPAQLSGGMQQRVAIARALAVEPDILFMDEPFGALDAITRMKLQTDILEIAQDTKKTVVFVTHDIEEAVFLADRIVIMSANPGRIKALLTVQLPKHRDRTSNDFLMIRDKVYEIFNMKSHETIEYYI